MTDCGAAKHTRVHSLLLLRERWNQPLRLMPMVFLSPHSTPPSAGFLTGVCPLGVLPIRHSSPLRPLDRPSPPCRSPRSSPLSISKDLVALSSAACPLESIFFQNSSAHVDVGVIRRVVGESPRVPNRFETVHSLTARQNKHSRQRRHRVCSDATADEKLIPHQLDRV